MSSYSTHNIIKDFVNYFFSIFSGGSDGKVSGYVTSYKNYNNVKTIDMDFQCIQKIDKFCL